MIEPLMLAALAADDYLRILGNNLVGVYVHGSLAFGSYHRDNSDIDLLVVVEREPGQAEKEAMIRVLLEREQDAPERGFELYVVSRQSCQRYHHPAAYFLHYSERFRIEATQNLPGFCRRMRGNEPELAYHFTVVKNSGLCLRGKPSDQVFAGVPEREFMEGLSALIEGAENEVRIRPAAVILDLCRALAFGEGGYLASKSQGGRWALTRTDGRWRELIREALDAHWAGEPMEVPDDGEDLCHYLRLRIDNAFSRRKLSLEQQERWDEENALAEESQVG